MKYPPHLTFAGETYQLSEQQWDKLGQIIIETVRMTDVGPLFPGKTITDAVKRFLVEEGFLPKPIH